MPRQSAAVYRRRRLVLLLGAILLLAVIGVAAWLLIARPWAGAAEKPAPTASSSATATATPTDAAETPSGEPTASETPGVVACEAKDIVVEAVTDAESYQPGVLPQLSIRLTNNGAADCTMDVGSTTQVFTVSSGDDVWWRSTDCQENPSSMIATLAAGATVESKTPVAWDRTRSSVETCGSENRPRAPGGGASYHVDVQIGGFPAAGSKQILLY
ncbi:hypothetical protein [Microbacterium sp. OVT16B]|uniref:hypothetical protein n=1 Tax=Microbacterium sp. OVT16B TaxID=2862682 RepID=UPI001CC176B4|nr:hypothetical protein [Microbacterium sp. OVT16B]